MKVKDTRKKQSVSSQSSITDDSKPAPQRAKRGRPSSYTPERAGEICKLVSSGLSLVKVARQLKIDLSSIYDWLHKDDAFAQNYARARDQRAEFIFEDVLTLEQQMLNGELGHNEFRAAVDARKWFLARMAPKNYGDTSKVELSGANGSPLTPIQVIVNFEEAESADS